VGVVWLALALQDAGRPLGLTVTVRLVAGLRE
jgi:hypothetical protein